VTIFPGPPFFCFRLFSSSPLSNFQDFSLCSAGPSPGVCFPPNDLVFLRPCVFGSFSVGSMDARSCPPQERFFFFLFVVFCRFCGPGFVPVLFFGLEPGHHVLPSPRPEPGHFSIFFDSISVAVFPQGFFFFFPSRCALGGNCLFFPVWLRFFSLFDSPLLFSSPEGMV